MNLKKRSNGIYMADFTDMYGVRTRKSTGLKIKSEARKKARELQYQHNKSSKRLVTPKKLPNNKGITLREAFQRALRTHPAWHQCVQDRKDRNLKSNFKIIEDAFGPDFPVDELTYTSMEKVAEDWLLSVSGSTVNRRLDTLKTVITLCGKKWDDPVTKRKLIRVIPEVPRYKSAEPKDRVLTLHEEEAALKYIDMQIDETAHVKWRAFKTLIMFMLDSGCRQGETLQLTWDMLVDDNMLLIPSEITKTSQEKNMPISHRVMEHMTFLEALKSNHCNKIFKDMTASRVWHMWKQVRDNVNSLSDANIHCLRHTCGTRLYEATENLILTANWLGHADLNTTRRIYIKKDKLNKHETLKQLMEGAMLRKGEPISAISSKGL